MRQSATAYSSLPGQPTMHALPQGVPFGPWQHLYRAAPGAQIPATYLPGMSRHPGRAMHGALGNVPGVSLVGGLGASQVTSPVALLGAVRYE